MAMKAYKSYKNVDLPWLKRVPEHWGIARNKNFLSEQKTTVGDNFANYSLLSLTLNGVIIRDVSNGKGKFPASFNTYKIVSPGNMIFCLFDIDETPRTVGLSTHYGMITNAYEVLGVHNINPQYLYYYYLQLDNRKALKPLYHGLRKTISVGTFLQTKLPVPPKEEQDQIVRYLDWQNSRLNKLINAKKKEIALLEELLASIISNCTSKVQLWHTKPFTKIAKICSNVVSSDCYKQSPQISPANIEKNTGCLISYGTVEESGIIGVNNLFFKGQILYSKIRPMLNKVTLAPVDGLCSTDIYPIETSLHAPYLIYFMLSGNFLSQIKTSDNRVKMPRLNKEELSSISVDFPDYDQQIKIARYLDIVRAKIKNSISSINNQIITLQEYRTRLVADVVTGQIDVRNIAIPNYETVPETIDQPETAEESAISTEDQ